MKQLKQRIIDSGLKQKFVADKVGVSEAYFAMMLNGNASMPEDIRNKVNELLKKVTI